MALKVVLRAWLVSYPGLFEREDNLETFLVCRLDDNLVNNLVGRNTRIVTMNNSFLENFVCASQDLTHALKWDCNLNELDRLRLENYLSVAQMAYIEWKQRNGPPSYVSAPLSEEDPLEDGEYDSRSSL